MSDDKVYSKDSKDICAWLGVSSNNPRAVK